MMKNQFLPRNARQTTRPYSSGRGKLRRVLCLLMVALMTLPTLLGAALPITAGLLPEVVSYTADVSHTEAEVFAEDPSEDISESEENAASGSGFSFARMLSLATRGVVKATYPYPRDAKAVTLYLDGKQVLKGHVADIGGVVYVPVQRFAELFGRFTTTYEQATERVVIKGTNLSVTVKVGDPYITVNERIFYTGHKVISLGGWIFVPITSMTKAMGGEVYVKKGYYEAYVTAGDPTKTAWASSYYNSDDLYWLSRIISAEAKGEPLSGQIAVGNVVLNRVRSASFPSTVKGVIFDSKYGVQFSPTANGTIYNTPTASAVMAAKICLEGYTLSSKALYFFNPAIATSSWISRTRPYIMTIGNHQFYG